MRSSYNPWTLRLCAWKIVADMKMRSSYNPKRYRVKRSRIVADMKMRSSYNICKQHYLRGELKVYGTILVLRLNCVRTTLNRFIASRATVVAGAYDLLLTIVPIRLRSGQALLPQGWQYCLLIIRVIRGYDFDGLTGQLDIDDCLLTISDFPRSSALISVYLRFLSWAFVRVLGSEKGVLEEFWKFSNFFWFSPWRCTYIG